jgi:hypothetical protein
MAEDESTSKLLAQATDLFTLFQQVGRSGAGLILLEIGWTLILVLATKLTGEEGSPAIAEVALTTWWLIGGAIILFLWVLYSRVYTYVTAPFVLPLKVLFDVVFLILAFIFLLLDLSLWPIAYPLHLLSVRRWTKQSKREWIERNVKRDPDTRKPIEDPEAAYAKFLTEFGQKHGEHMLRTLAAEGAAIQIWNFSRLGPFIRDKFLTPLHSGIRVGVAPFVVHSSVDKFIRERAPLLRFGTAMANLMVGLIPDIGLKDISCTPLPFLFSVGSLSGARFAAKFFHVDVLLWGRINEGDEQKAYIYVEGASPHLELEDSYATTYQKSLFADRLDFVEAVSVMVCRLDDLLDLQITLLLALFHAFRKRWDLGKRRWGLLAWDRVYPAANAYTDKLLAHLAFEVLPLVPDQPVEPELVPSAEAVLVDVVSRWCGNKLSPLNGDDRWEDRYERFAGQLVAILEKCAKVDPLRPDHFYRLGAACCIVEKGERAIEAFREAGKLDRMSDRINAIAAVVDAKLTLDIECSGRREEHGLSKFAAFAARAICCGSAKRIKEIMDESQIVRMIKYGEKVPVSLSVVDQMLAEAIPPAAVQSSME